MIDHEGLANRHGTKVINIPVYPPNPSIGFLRNFQQLVMLLDFLPHRGKDMGDYPKLNYLTGFLMIATADASK